MKLATHKTDEYTAVLLQGSGTYCVEATLGSVITPKHKLLILSNGAYGDRMGNIAEYHGMNYDMLAFDETEQVSVEYVDDYLAHNAEITHVAVVHCETTTGILNPLKEIAHMVKMHGKKWHVLFPWTSTTNGKQWRRDTANGASPLPLTWYALLSRPWTN